LSHGQQQAEGELTYRQDTESELPDGNEADGGSSDCDYAPGDLPPTCEGVFADRDVN